jgi:hypothetical protein
MSKMITPIVNGAFLALAEARIAPGGDEDSAKYQLTIVLPSEHEWWGTLDKAIKETATAKWGKVPAKAVLPVKCGDDTDYEEFAGNNTVTVASKRRPQVVDKNRKPILDFDDIGSGDRFIVSLQPYAWEFPPLNRKGVSLSLSNVMWVGEGETRWDGGSSAESDFADTVVEEGESDSLLD